jgi:hypothetical protein
VESSVKHSDRSEKPTVVKPMLATLVKQPFTDPDYVYEVKWDGYRIIAICERGKVKLQSRGGEDYTKKYPSIAKAVQALEVDCIIDGEVVYVNSEGKPDFDSSVRNVLRFSDSTHPPITNSWRFSVVTFNHFLLLSGKDMLEAVEGLYTLKVTIDNCSSNLSDLMSHVVTGLANPVESNVKIYANPATSHLSIDLPFASNSYILRLLHCDGSRAVGARETQHTFE